MQDSLAAESERLSRVMLRSHVERCLQDIWDVPRPAVDGDGDYPFRHGTAMCWVTLMLDSPVAGVRVLGHAATGLRSSAKLLGELNELNNRSRWARVALAGGVVEVRVELHWAAVGRHSLDQAIGSVGQVADDVGALLATVYGGRTPFPPKLDETDHSAGEGAA
jgi:hypothetical protein